MKDTISKKVKTLEKKRDDELKKIKAEYDAKIKAVISDYKHPLKKCEDNSRSYPMQADSMSKIYGSKKAAVVYNPGCLNGANWRVCGLDDTGEYETF